MLWTILIFNELRRYQRSVIKENGQDTSQYVATTSKDVSIIYVPVETSLQRVKLVSLTYVPAGHRYDVSNWLVIFKYQRDIAKTSQIGPSYWRTSWDIVSDDFLGGVLGSTFFGISDGSVSWSYQLVRRCNVSKMSVSFRY